MAAANKDPVEDQILQTLKTLNVGRANEELAKIFMHFGTSPIEILKMNSYMMSALADQNKINKIHGARKRNIHNEFLFLILQIRVDMVRRIILNGYHSHVKNLSKSNFNNKLTPLVVFAGIGAENRARAKSKTRMKRLFHPY